MFGRRAKRKWKPRVNLAVASHLEFEVVTYGQEPTDCQGFNAVCAARTNALLRYFDLDDDKNFLRNVALRSWLGIKGVDKRCFGEWSLPGDVQEGGKIMEEEKQICCLFPPEGELQ